MDKTRYQYSDLEQPMIWHYDDANPLEKRKDVPINWRDDRIYKYSGLDDFQWLKEGNIMKDENMSDESKWRLNEFQ